MSGETAAILAGLNLDLSEKKLQQLGALLALIAADEHAPTAVRDPREGAKTHIADSLAALEVEQVSAADVLADIGSGAGFPGVPLAVALPHARVSLVESQ